MIEKESERDGEIDRQRYTEYYSGNNGSRVCAYSTRIIPINHIHFRLYAL